MDAKQKEEKSCTCLHIPAPLSAERLPGDTWLFAFLNAWPALTKAKVVYRGEEEDAEPHGPSATDSSPGGELHKYPEPPKPLTKRSCSLLHTEGSWKASEGSLSLHCCALLPSHSPLAAKDAAIMRPSKLKALYHLLSCCRPATQLFHLSPPTHFSQV